MESPDGQTTVGMVNCLAREAGWWDGLLNTVYSELRGRVSEQARLELREIQRQWIRYRDAKCAFPQTFFEGGTIAGPMSVECNMRTTAMRAIELREWLTFGE